MFRLSLRICAIVLGLLTVDGDAEAQEPRSLDRLSLRDAGFAFRGCDGFGGVSRSGDGVLGPARGIEALGRMRPDFAQGHTNCDIAIAVLQRDAPQYWIRRVNLLHARSIHRLVEGDAQGAIADLELAEQAVQERSDHYLRTLDVNSKLIRGMALVMMGDADGQVLASEAHSQRPYSVPTLLAGLMVVGLDGEPSRAEALVSDLARLNPRLPQVPAAQLVGLLPDRDLEAFFMMMLEPESPNRRGRGWEAGRSMVALGAARDIARAACNIETGNGAPNEDNRDIVQLCDFRFDTFAGVQDRMAAAAARAALAQGRPYFLILERDDVAHWAIPQFGRVEVPSGTESRLTIRLEQEDCPRCLTAQTVLHDLGDRYPAAPSR